MKKLVFSVLVSVVFAMPAYSEMMDMPMMEHKDAHGPMVGMDKMGDMAEMCIKHADKIGLSDEQLMKIKPAHNEMKKKQIRFNADVKIAELELAEIMDVKDFDLEKAGAAVKKIAEIKTAKNLEMLKAMKEIRSTLTDEQFKKMQKMMPMMMAEKKPAKKMMKMKK